MSGIQLWRSGSQYMQVRTDGFSAGFIVHEDGRYYRQRWEQWLEIATLPDDAVRLIPAFNDDRATGTIVRDATVRAHDSLCPEPACVLAVDHVAGHWTPGTHWGAT